MFNQGLVAPNKKILDIFRSNPFISEALCSIVEGTTMCAQIFTVGFAQCILFVPCSLNKLLLFVLLSDTIQSAHKLHWNERRSRLWWHFKCKDKACSLSWLTTIIAVKPMQVYILEPLYVHTHMEVHAHTERTKTRTLKRQAQLMSTHCF